MGFLACPQCGQINRDSDSECFSCKADLTGVPPPPPPPVPVEEAVAATPAGPELDVRVARIAGQKTDGGHFKDLASRYEAKPTPKMDSGVMQGLRSGLIGGAFVGAAMGFLRTQLPDDVTKLIIRKYPTIKPDGFDIWKFTFIGDLVFGLILGAILGFINQLCWQPESARTGAIIGVLVACVTYYICGHGQNVVSIVVGTFHGYALAWIISGIERKMFRGL